MLSFKEATSPPAGVAPPPKLSPLLGAISYFSLGSFIRCSIVKSVLLPIQMKSKLKLHLFLKSFESGEAVTFGNSPPRIFCAAYCRVN